MNKLLGCFGAAVLLVGVSVLSYVLNGWALVKLWGWFVLPRFASAPSLSISQAIGIAIVVSFLTSQSIPDEKNDDTPGEKIGKAVTVALLKPLIAVGIGWIVAQYV